MIVYSKFNSHRSKRFQLITSIEKNDNVLSVFKIAQSKKSVVFLNSLVHKYKYLHTNKFSFEPVAPKIKNNYEIEFKYHDEEVFSQLLFSAFQEENKEKIYFLVNKYVELVKKNGIINSHLSQGFQKIFGKSDIEKIECVKIGCLDLNFDNIIIFEKGLKGIVFDYEWTFEFAIPYKYIIHRALTNFYYMFSSYDLNRVINLDELCNLFEISNSEKKIFLKMEYNFQNYVNDGDKKDGFDKFKENYFELEKNRNKSSNFIDNIQKKDLEIANFNQVIQQKDEILRQNYSIIKENNQEILKLQNSKSFKLGDLFFRSIKSSYKMITYPYNFIRILLSKN